MTNALFAIIVIIIIMLLLSRENFTSRREKAETIFNWWKSTPAHSYEKYKSDIDGSDVIEYLNVREKLRKIPQSSLSVDDVYRVIN